MAPDAFVPLMGYTPDPEGSAAFVGSLPHPTLASAGPDLQAAKTDVNLGLALLKCSPSWKRGSQPIGSCVGWGYAMSVDVLAAPLFAWLAWRTSSATMRLCGAVA